MEIIDQNLGYRPNVCMLVQNTAGKILLGERAGAAGIWQFPQGGAEPELSLEENVYKELQEELGAGRELFQISQRFFTTHKYDFRVTPDFAKGKWRGQEQSFWLVKFLGEDKDINLNAHEKPEFVNFCWCEIDAILSIADPIRKESYAKVISELKGSELKNLS